MKISIVTPRFAISGVPLAQVRFARALAKRGHLVSLFVGYLEPGYELPIVPGVRIENWNKRKVRGILWPLFLHLRREKPDVLFSAEDHLNAIALVAAIFSGSNVKTSGSSRVIPTDRLGYSTKPFSKGWFLKQLMRSVMWRANALTCVSKDMVAHYQKIFRRAPHVCVYNIIKDQNSLMRSAEPADHPWLISKDLPVIISAGTMTKRKGFADLIHAFSIVCSLRPCRLIILGDGYLRNSLTALVDELKIDDKVSFPGNVENPLKYFSRSDVFVLSSYAEGMPNVLVEAMMCGCTPVATDCPTGPGELLRGGGVGYLTPMGDPSSMATAIVHALDSPIGKNVLTAAVEPFEESAVINRHFEVLELPVSDE